LLGIVGERLTQRLRLDVFRNILSQGEIKITFFHKSNYFRKMFKKYKIKIKEKFTKINLIIKTEIQDKYIRSLEYFYIVN